MNRYILLIILFLLCLCAALACLLERQRAEMARLAGNQQALLENISFYRTNDSLSAAGIEQLVLTSREFGRYCTDLREVVEGLNVRLARLESVATAGTETRYEVKTLVRDSVVIRDSMGGNADPDTLRCMDLHTPYLDFSGCMEGNRFTGVVLSRDTLVQVVHRVPHRFWFIRWGTKAIRQEIVSRNPHSRITYTQYIKINKSRR